MQRMSAEAAQSARFKVTVSYTKNGEEQVLEAARKPLTLTELDRIMSVLARYRKDWGVLELTIEEVPPRPWTPELREMYERELERYQEEPPELRMAV